MPPRRGEVTSAVDAILSPGEFHGAVELPMANLAFHDSVGHAFVTLDNDTRLLRVFFENIAIGVESEQLSIIIDHERYAPETPATVSPPDRRYFVNLQTNELSVYAPLTPEDVTGWVREPTLPEGYDARAECAEPGNSLVKRRCNVEFNIRLSPQDLESPAFTPGDPRPLPGIGFAVADSERKLVFPEELAGGLDEVILFDRSQYATLLFGKPEGVPFTFMSWNMARWDTDIEWEVTDDALRGVLLSELAQVIAQTDIVAVQEMWSRDDAFQLLQLVNIQRAGLGLPPMFLNGPASASVDMLESAGINLTGDPQAGLFVFSRFRAIDRGHEFYDACRGEDCLKPKGVQWVRLALGDPTPADLSPGCTGGQREPDAGCGPTPTSEMYIDVFNTHLQADAEVCGSLDQVLALHLAILGTCNAAPLVPPGLCETLVTALFGAEVALDTSLHCGVEDEEVRKSQLAQMGDYIRGVTTEDQPALIAGDFNINGRTIRNFPYQSLLGALDLRTDMAVGDALSPDPEAFLWDIDHADIARDIDTLRWDECGLGTSIGAGPDSRQLAGTSRPGCGALAQACGRASDTRLDYILVRPETRYAESTSPAGYTLSQRSGEVLWAPLWPAVQQFGHFCADSRGLTPNIPNGSVLRRLSDHRPIVANLELSILRQPGRYHPDWTHVMESRVTSVNVSSVEDCLLNICGPADPYVKLVGFRFTPANVRQPAPGEINRGRCENEAAGALSWPRYACMDNWVYRSLPVEPGEYLRSEVAWQLQEVDMILAPDDEIFTINDPSSGPGINNHPNFRVLWDRSQFDISPERGDRFNPPGWAGAQSILSSDPIRWCTSNRSPSICVRTTLEEQ